MLRFHFIIAIISTLALAKLSQAQPNPCLSSPCGSFDCIWLSASQNLYACICPNGVAPLNQQCTTALTPTTTIASSSIQCPKNDICQNGGTCFYDSTKIVINQLKHKFLY